MIKFLALFSLVLPLQVFAGVFMFGGAPTPPSTPQRIEPPSPTRGNSRPSRIDPDIAPAQRRTEATACPTCGGISQPARRPSITRIDTGRIAGTSDARPTANTGGTSVARSSATTGDACLRNAILNAAKENVRRRYGNRPYSGGMCAQGVRLSLNASGIIHSGGMGDAISWHLGGTLKAKGFVNIMPKGFNAANAPPGAVLVFRGPSTNMSRANGGLPRRSARRGRSAGNWVGHVTIKGERPGRYYTDGRTEEPAIARRTLVAVYVPVECVNCRGAAARCGR